MKGLFIPEITAEMFRNGCLESIEELMAEGEIYDIEYSKWIPVSEKLPEKDGQYLVTVKKGYMLIGLWCGIKEDWGNVIAWMPLPQPYKAESEEV